MQPIESKLTGQQKTFGMVREVLEADGFTLANNWEYDRGLFDCKLDDQGTVFLRLPFTVVHGKLDFPDTRIEFGTPFVLKHLYQEGIEKNIGYSIGPNVAAAINQFQEPVEKDAPVEAKWVEQAKMILGLVEQHLST